MANLRQWKPGQSGNPKGRPANAGRSIIERMNDFQNYRVPELVAIAEDSQASIIDVTAAHLRVNSSSTTNSFSCRPSSVLSVTKS